jgi:hypothetical protein
MTYKDASKKSIKLCKKEDILWCFIHQSVKGDSMSKMYGSSVWAVCNSFAWVTTESALRVVNPFQVMWVDSTCFNFTDTISQKQCLEGSRNRATFAEF